VDLSLFYAIIRYPAGHAAGAIIESRSIDRAQAAAQRRATRAKATLVSVEKYDPEKHGSGRSCCVRRG